MNKSIKEVSKQYMLKYLQFIDLFDPLAIVKLNFIIKYNMNENNKLSKK